jgi:hypothetical protein
MASPVVDINQVEGNLKDIFGGYELAIPKEDILMREFSFDDSNKIGDEYQHGVELTRPQGFTTAASGVFPALNAPVARESPKAKVQPWQMYLRERVTYEVLSRCQDSKQSAKAELGATIESMRDSFMFRQECLGFYGQMGLAVVGTVTSDACSITSPSWAAGMWAGNENMPLTVRTSAGVDAGLVVIDWVDFDNLTINFVTGGGTVLSAAGADATLWFQGGSSTAELVGIKKVLANTGTLYNISAAQYGLWKGVTGSVTSGWDLTFLQAIRLDARIRARGGMGDQLAFVNSDVFTTLEGTIEGARTFSGPEQYRPTQIDRGTMELTFYSPVGKTTIKPHPIVKRGDYFSVRSGKWKRVGSSDPTFEVAGEGRMLHDLQDYPGKELREMAFNTWFTPRPAASGYLDGITFMGTTS